MQSESIFMPVIRPVVAVLAGLFCVFAVSSIWWGNWSTSADRWSNVWMLFCMFTVSQSLISWTIITSPDYADTVLNQPRSPYIQRLANYVVLPSGAAVWIMIVLSLFKGFAKGFDLAGPSTLSLIVLALGAVFNVAAIQMNFAQGWALVRRHRHSQAHP